MKLPPALSTSGRSLLLACLLAPGGADLGWAASALDGPAPPAPPLTISRDQQGRATLRAIRLEQPIRLDGALDEPVYASVAAAGGFIQQEPHEGRPASEPTEVWVFFDDRNLYVAARCYDSQPERMVANELRRDHFNVFENENFGVILDTFYDRRNGFFFYTNPLGAISDQTVTDERDSNRDWNTVWDVRTGRFEHGWTVEMAIPFKSLRYGASPYWGINFRRRVRWKNEMSYLTLVPASAGRRGMLKLSSAGTLVGLEPPHNSLSLELKPYVTAGLQTDREAQPAFDNAREAQAGLDLKYGITKSLTFDVTVNTDFAQVEDDDQQVNLSRFSLFFPEKRDFFLEGQGLFSFGNADSRSAIPSRSPILFFSRRIGLVEDEEEGTQEAVPILAGARLTGKAGAFGIGALHLRTDAADSGILPKTDFSVLRVKRDILRRSTIGLIATRRSPSSAGPDGANESYGADASFSLGENLLLSGYYALTRTPGLDGDDRSWNARLDYSGDRYGVQAERLVVGESFNPELGFVPREDIRRSFVQGRFSPRPASLAAIRKLGLEASYDAYENGRGQLETREIETSFRVDFENSDELRIGYTHSYEFIDEAFDLTDDVTIPVGTYQWNGVEARYELGRQRRLSGELEAGYGGFYGGSRAQAGFSGRLEVSRRLSVEPRIGVNWIELPQASFTTTLLGLRVNAAFSPRIFLGALVQYNSEAGTLGSNLRFRWEYRPGSEIFLVYADGWDTSLPGRALLRNRSLVLKVTRLLRF